MQDEDIPRVELFGNLDSAESGLAGTGMAAATLVAVYRLDADGVAVREGGPDWLDDVRVIEADDTPTLVPPSEGERYLRALPDAFSGTRCRAVLIDDQAGGNR
jgi:hypothetical protein